jgi:undecaprenyl-diphosphatase
MHVLPVMFQAAILGVVQGLAEFLPISSSAHLILARLFFGFDADRFGLPFDVACHLGTLLAILLYFREDLLRMLAAAPRILSTARHTDPAAKLGWLVILGTLPVVVVGLALRNAEDSLRTPAVAATTLAIGGVLLLVAERVARRVRLAEDLGPAEALALGVAQSAALVPGVSRSGATITLALFLGLKRDAAARFSFLLGVPAISAAVAHEGIALLREPMSRDTVALFAIGTGVSAIVGYLTIKYFLRFLASHSLSVFAWYRLALAAAVVAWFAAP